MPGATNVSILEEQLKTAWNAIDAKILANLIKRMPERIKKCIELNGEYIGK